MLRGRSLTAKEPRLLWVAENSQQPRAGRSMKQLHSHVVLYWSPPCVRGPDVIEVTHGLAATTHRVGLVAESLDIQLPSGRAGGRDHTARDALARRRPRSEWRLGCWPSHAISPEQAWSLLVRLSQNGHVKVQEIAEAVVEGALRSGRSPRRSSSARLRNTCLKAYALCRRRRTGGGIPRRGDDSARHVVVGEPSSNTMTIAISGRGKPCMNRAGRGG